MSTWRETHPWPSREEWAKHERTAYAGDEVPWQCYPADRPTLTVEEVEATVAALETLERANRRAVREARRLAAPHLRRPRELFRPWFVRYRALPAEARDLVDTVESLSLTGRSLRVLLKAFRASQRADSIDVDALPESYEIHHLPDALVAPVPALGALVARRLAHHDAAHAAYIAQCAARPVDDAAWERELARRRAIDADLDAPPERWIVRA